MPEIISQQPEIVTGTAAALSANVLPNGEITEIYFQFGVTTNYGSFSTTNMLWGSEGALAVTNEISGLTPGTTYHYQTVALNLLGGTLGSDSTFTTPTLAAMPDVIIRADGVRAIITAADLLTNDVTLSGILSVLSVTPLSIGGGSVTLAGGQITYTPVDDPEEDSFGYTITDGNGNTANGTVTVRIGIPPHHIQPLALSIVGEPGIFTLYSVGMPERTYKLQYTPAVNGSWKDLETVVADDEGFFWSTNLLDQSGTMFYRAVLP